MSTQDGPLGPLGPMSTLVGQQRAVQLRDACAQQDCRYRDPKRTRQQCEQDLDARCLGYQAHVYLEHGQPILRWARCARFQAWWRAEKERIQEEKRRRQTQKRLEHSGGARHFPTEGD